MGYITASERVGDVKDAAIIKLDPEVGAPEGNPNGVVGASAYSLESDSGSPGFVKNPDATVSAVGLLLSSPDGDDNTTYFAMVAPLRSQWGLTILE